MTKKSSSHESESDPQAKGGFILDRRKNSSSFDSQETLSLETVSMEQKGVVAGKKSQTYSLKRFFKYVGANQKVHKKNGKQFCIARLSVLELDTVQSDYGEEVAKEFDQFVLDIILDLLRKSDRIYSIKRGDYLVLLPNTDEGQAPLALSRIAEILGESTFESSQLSIRPSSLFSIINGADYLDSSNLEILQKLKVELTKDEENDLLSSKKLANPVKQKEFFSGSTSEWISRYRLLEPDSSLILNKDFDFCGILEADLELAIDSWGKDSLVLIRRLRLKDLESDLFGLKRKEVVSYMRQIQSLRSSSLEGLLDFHLDTSELYLVDRLPNKPVFVSTKSIRSIEQIDSSSDLPSGIEWHKLLSKLAGAFSSLQSLSPPVVLGGFENLLLVFENDYSRQSRSPYKNMRVINHEIFHLEKILSGFSTKTSEEEHLNQFIDYAIKLELNYFESGSSIMERSFAKAKQLAKNSKYNSFSKLRALIEDERKQYA